MSIFKCKMCGGDLEISEGATIAECEYCGTRQTVPKAMDENLQNLFNRANTLRIKSEFDKAEKLYEKIIQADTTQSEAYWGLILCKYGIEYVDDPATFKKIPTCHRASYDSIIADDDYKSALENADISQRTLYEEQAKEIDRIQKEILALAQKEESYDVFICYKETDANGQRTQDSVIANDIYYQLTNEGFKVFYAAITLEGKLGSAYEPIIFAALHSAKVMLSIGTKPEYFNAVWVKNEWSRFLKIIKKDRTKLLIPCYRDMDAYELPEEFAHLQAQDMSKIGFINDVVRGIKKVIQKNDPKQTTVVKETVISNANANVAPLLKRAFMFLEDGDWENADKFCEQVLNQDPENAQAYLGKLMAELRVKKQDELKDQAEPFDNRNNYKKAVRFGDEKLKSTLVSYIEYINTRNENARLEGIYNQATTAMESAKSSTKYEDAANIFRTILNYKDSETLVAKCLENAEKARAEERERAEIARKDSIYNGAIALMNKPAGIANKFSTTHCEEAIKEFQKISGWRDSDEKIIVCQQKIEELKAQAETDRLEKERLAEIARIEAEKRAKRNKKIAIITTPIVCAVIALIIVLNTVIIPDGKYNDAVTLMENGEYAKAYDILVDISDYKDSQAFISKAQEVIGAQAEELYLSGRASEAQELAKTVGLPISTVYGHVANGEYKQAMASGLTNIIIPNGITSIGWSAFSDSPNLKSVVIPDSVTTIKSSAFENCTALQTITIPNSVTSIGNSAFHQCTSLKSIVIPDSVTSIGGYTFKGCTSLASIVIPDGVTSIGNYAFSNCTSLASIEIPDSVTSIGYSAFLYCTSLTSITIPDSVTRIGQSAFSNCTSLTSVVIPDSVTCISDSAFWDCTSLTSITIPDSVTSIGYSAFLHCESLTKINFEGTKAQWKAISKGSIWNSDTGNYTVYCTDGNITK